LGILKSIGALLRRGARAISLLHITAAILDESAAKAPDLP
jgi:hypothetical protein